MAAGIGEAASILSILGVTGQAIESASTLYTFCKAYKEVNSELERILQDVGSLLSRMVEITRLLPALSAGSSSPEILEAVQRRIQTCNADLATWAGKIDSLSSDIAKGSKAVFKKVKIAADKGYFSGIRANLSSNREEITLLIAVLTSHTSSKTLLNSNMTIYSLDALREDQTSIRDESFQRFDVLHQGINVLLAHTSTLDEKLQSLALFEHASTMSNETQWRQSIDARLRRAEKQTPKWRRLPKVGSLAHRPKRVQNLSTLKASETTGILTSLPRVEINHKFPECTRSFPFRVVKPAILIQEEHGIMSRELLALEDKRFNSANSNRKLALIQYIQKLRLILWLLERRNYLTFRSVYLGRPVQSFLTYLGGLNSSWDLANTYTDLLQGLTVKNVDLSTTMPWTRKKAWLQYMFDRVRDQEGHAEATMHKILNLWERFPAPDEGELPQCGYYLTIPNPSIYERAVSQVDRRNGGPVKSLNEGNDHFGEYDQLGEHDYSGLLQPWHYWDWSMFFGSSLDMRPCARSSVDPFSCDSFPVQCLDTINELLQPGSLGVERKSERFAITTIHTRESSRIRDKKFSRSSTPWLRAYASCSTGMWSKNESTIIQRS